MVLDASLVNTHHYKVRIKGEKEQSRERSCAFGVVTIEEEAFGLPSAMATNFTFKPQNVCIYFTKFVLNKTI